MIIFAFSYGPFHHIKIINHVEIIIPISCSGSRCENCKNISEKAKGQRPETCNMHFLTYQVSRASGCVQLLDKHWKNTTHKVYSYIILSKIPTLACMTFLNEQLGKPFNKAVQDINLYCGLPLTTLKGITNKTSHIDSYNHPSWICSELASTLLQINEESKIIQNKHPCIISPGTLLKLCTKYINSNINAGYSIDRGEDLINHLPNIKPPPLTILFTIDEPPPPQPQSDNWYDDDSDDEDDTFNRTSRYEPIIKESS
jgi:hypothetical protein